MRPLAVAPRGGGSRARAGGRARRGLCAAAPEAVASQVALARPLLKRYHAHPFSSDCVRCCPNSGEHRHLTSDEHQARDLARTVIRAYENQPVKGTPLYLPDGRAVAADARRPRSYLAPSRARHVARPPPNPQVWADLLHDELFEILEDEEFERYLREYNPVNWLKHLKGIFPGL